MAVSDKRLLNLLRQVMDKRTDGHCEWPGCCQVDCDPHHIFHKSHKSVRYFPGNLVNLCNAHHRYAEANPHDFRYEMVVMRGNDWWIDLVQRKNEVVKFDNHFREMWKEILLKELGE